MRNCGLIHFAPLWAAVGDGVLAGTARTVAGCTHGHPGAAAHCGAPSVRPGTVTVSSSASMHSVMLPAIVTGRGIETTHGRQPTESV
jgi:hypothetical protein